MPISFSPPSSSCVCKCTWIFRMSRNVYVSNTIHTMQPNVKNILKALHQVLVMKLRFRLRVICRRSFIGVGARDEEHESESDEHMSLRFRLTPTIVPVSASSSFRLRIFLPPTTADDLLLTSLLIGTRSKRRHGASTVHEYYAEHRTPNIIRSDIYLVKKSIFFKLKAIAITGHCHHRTSEPLPNMGGAIRGTDASAVHAV